jgi:hypothetical protein
MKKYIALVVRLNNASKHYVLSSPGESKERFIERVNNCYVKPYSTPYFDVEMFELGESID